MVSGHPTAIGNSKTDEKKREAEDKENNFLFY
jgi:hypothetical protein